MALQNTSFSTRLLNPKISWLSFLKSPWYGHGIHGMQIDRDLIILDQGFAGNVDAATNTSFSLLATFGVFGSLFTIALILGILFCNEEIFSNKILLLIIFLVIINKEPHTNILLTWIFVFFFIKESFDEKIIQKKYPTIEEKFQIKLFLKGGNDTAVLSKNLVGTILIKGMALIISFFSVSVFSKYFNNDHTYGLWLAILSVLSWIMTFDLGLGNGMKNSLIDSFHRGTEEKSKKIIASSYLSSIFIALFLFLIGVVLALSINLNNLFNISEELVSPALLKTVMIITLFGISLEFVLKNISYIFHSLQKQLYAGIFSFISSLLLFIFAFTFKFQNITLQFVILSVIYVIFYNFPYLIGTIYIFKKPLKNIRPKISDFDTKVAKEVMGVGIIFFLMQISLLFLNSTNSILIANIFGSDVVVYFTKYTKLFNVILSLFTVMTLTLWAAIRKAYVNKNQKWIKKMNFYFHLLAVVMVMLCGTIVLFLQPIFNIWLGDATIIVDWVIALVCFASISVRLFTTVSSAISNGLQTLKPQLICLLTGVIIKIPLVFIIKLLFVNVPWYSIIVVDIMCYIPLLVILPIANYRKIKNMSWKEDSVVS